MENSCVKCGSFAARQCKLCGFLCIEHTCEHLHDAPQIDVVEELPSPDFVNSPDDYNDYQGYEVVNKLRNFLSDEVMIASMDNAQLKTALQRYRNIVRTIEHEFLRRKSEPVCPSIPARNRGEETHRRTKAKTPLSRMVKAIKDGILTKEMVEALLHRGDK